MKFVSSRTLRALVATSILACGAAFGQASTWPDRQVRIIMPFPAGGASDVMTRLLAERLQAKLGQPFCEAGKSTKAGVVMKSLTDRCLGMAFSVLGAASNPCIGPN